MSESKNGINWCDIMSLIFAGFLIGAVVLTAIMMERRVKPLQSKAVEMGVADWLVNPKDGTTKFTWKEKKP